MLGGIWEQYRGRRYFALFLSLLITIAGHGALGALGPGVTVLEVLLAITLVTAIAAAFQDRAIRILLALAAGFVVTRGVGGLLGVRFLMPISQALWVLASLIAIVATLRHALRAKIVDTERIFAALDAYLLTGLMFGVCYWVLDQVSPGAFGAPSASDLMLDQAVYFSFVTIATVGYGDIVPVGPGARGLTILEGVMGQMYLAVLMAWLVSLFARERES
jgi:hypothetical protein